MDSRGALIGINSAIITRSGGNNGIGFAIEVDMAKNIARKLVESGTIDRGYLGVYIGDMTKELRNLYKSKEGALLLEVKDGSPAGKAGLERGDLIIKVKDHTVSNAADLKNKIGMFLPDTKVLITYERDKKIKKTTVLLGNLGDSGESNEALIEGLSLQELDDQTRYQYKIPNDIDGVLVSAVTPGSEADNQNIARGDVIVQIENRAVSSIKELNQILKKYKDEYKRVYINRNGRIFVVALK